MLAEPIPCVTGLRPATFHAEFLREGRPVVVRGALSSSTARQRWNLEYLAAADGNRRVAFNTSNQIYADLLGTGLQLEGTVVTLKYFLHALRSCASDPRLQPPRPGVERASIETRNRIIAGVNDFGIPLYLPMSPLEDYTTLSDEFVVPEFFGDPTGVFRGLWIGPSMGSLHYDTVDGILCQLSARKHATLIAPSDARNVYLNDLLHPLPNHSRAGFFHGVESVVDAEHPRLRRATRYTTVLEPGDALFIPNGWFHGLMAEPDSISVTCWRSLPRRRWYTRWRNARILVGQQLKRALVRPRARYYSLRP